MQTNKAYLRQIASVLAHLESCRRLDPENSKKYEQEMNEYFLEVLPTIKIEDLMLLDDLIQTKLFKK